MLAASLVTQNGAPRAGADAWCEAEAPMLADHRQLTPSEAYTRAGEAYFSPDAGWVVFQAIPRGATGASVTEHYQMFVAPIRPDAAAPSSLCPGDGAPDAPPALALGQPVVINTPHSASTCGWFHPTEPWRIMFGCTIVKPAESEPAGFQRDRSSYAWQFPREMEVVEFRVGAVHRDLSARKLTSEPWERTPLGYRAEPIFSRDGYDAECAYSPDGRFIIYTHMDPDTRDADIWVYDTRTKTQTALVEAEGYDGGPFFSPDGKSICYRSDREGTDLLQIYVATLKFNDDGAITGIDEEFQVTDNDDVNWAPYWHPSGEFLVYTSSEIGHHNYEVFSIEVPLGKNHAKPPAQLRKKRITHAPGFDGLPVFSPDGKYLMWTSQRAGPLPGEERPSSQLWIARVVDVKP